MRTHPRARLVFRLRQLVYVLPLALPAGIDLSMYLSHRGMPVSTLMIPPELALGGWLVLTIFVSARATVRLLHIRPQSNNVMVIPAILLGLVIFALYSGLSLLFARCINLILVNSPV